MAEGALIGRDDPVVILAKGHSGTRFLAQALESNGIFMGSDLNPMHDSLAWADDFAKPLVVSDWFPNFDEDGRPDLTVEIDARLRTTLANYSVRAEPAGMWGWKGSTTFVMDPLLRRFPGLRLVHLIRDGRDVVLSEDGYLNLPFWHPVPRRPDRAIAALARRYGTDRTVDTYRRRIYFGNDAAQWHDVAVTRASVEAHRYLVQMEGWIRNVEVLRKIGTHLGDRYLEIRYEELVTEPTRVVTEVLDHVSSPITPATASFVETHAVRSSLRKWESHPPVGERAADFERACAHGAELLADLGYH